MDYSKIRKKAYLFESEIYNYKPHRKEPLFSLSINDCYFSFIHFVIDKHNILKY